MRNHIIRLDKDEYENVVASSCEDCGMSLRTPADHHPPAYCLLVKAGEDPIALVQRAAEHVPAKPELPSVVTSLTPKELSQNGHPSLAPVAE